MSKSKVTRATKIKDEPGTSSKPKINAPALRKIFYISQTMLEDGTQKLRLERFFHPGKGKSTLFMTKDDKHIMEVIEFAEPRRSWLINSEVCSNGHIYLTAPVDATFLALYHLRKHCLSKALSLDNIHDDEDVTVSRLLNTFIQPELLKGIADVKKAGGDLFYKYNHDKCMAWLSLKTKRVAEALRKSGIYCGNSAVSQNFARSEKDVDETATDMDYNRMACDYVGGYLSLDLHEELIKHLKIPIEKLSAPEEKKTASTKRKSGDKLNSDTKKKQKLENGAAAKLKDSSLLDESPDDEVENRVNNSIKEETSTSPKDVSSTPLKERSLSAKEKTLAKSAKGTKSITSFFMKKST